MQYTTQADIAAIIPESVLIQLTDDAVPPVAINSTVISQTIVQATSIIDGYVGGVYSLPFTSLPELIKTLALDIVVYRLYLRRKKNDPPEAVKQAFETALKLLRDVASGKITLGSDAVGVVPTVVRTGVISSKQTRFFSDDVMGCMP